MLLQKTVKSLCSNVFGAFLIVIALFTEDRLYCAIIFSTPCDHFVSFCFIKLTIICILLEIVDFILFFRVLVARRYLERFYGSIQRTSVLLKHLNNNMDALLSQSVLKPGFQKNYKVPVNDKSSKILKRIKKVFLSCL